MTAVRQNIEFIEGVVHAYRGIEVRAVAADDIEFLSPVTVRVVTGGDLTYEDALGTQHTLSGLTAGADVVGPGGGLVLVSKVFGTSTVTSIIIGLA